MQTLLLKDEHVLEAISEEGLFEAARLASPILPQYHPKLLIELLNSGRTRMVKAILLHVLKSLKVNAAILCIKYASLDQIILWQIIQQ